MSYSLQQAADAAGVNKSTVLRAIQAGKVSAIRSEHGQWVIEPAELHRVYPPAAGNGKRTSAGNDAHQADISEAKRFLGFQPKVDLEEGLRRSIEYYRSL